MKNQNFIIRVKIALFGIKDAFKEERNFRIQLIVGVLVVIAMQLLGLSSIEKALLLLTMVVVLSLELINSQIEKFLDIIQPDHHPRVKIIKDFSAAAVLVSVIGSIIIGVLIFSTHLSWIMIW